jgi:hypothetical protein
MSISASTERCWKAWASDKSFQKKTDSPKTGTGRGETLLNDTHASRTDPDARKYRKSGGAAFKLVHMRPFLRGEHRESIL